MPGESAAPPANSRFFVLALGLLVGFVIGFIALLANLPVDQSTVDFHASPVAGGAGGRTPTNFEFYTVLAGDDDDAASVPSPAAVEASPAAQSVAVEQTSRASTERGVVQAPRQVVEASARTNAETLARATAGPDAIPVERPDSAEPVTRPATRVVPGSAQSPSAQESTAGRSAAAAVPAAGTETYFLQAGNFAEARAAERMRASVLLLGLEAFIVTRQEPSGALGHRVRIGPFHDQDRLTDAKLRLRRGNLAYQIVRVTG